MKRKIVLLMWSVSVAAGMLMDQAAANLIAADEASNYHPDTAPWNNGANQGVGFGSWDLYGTSGNGEGWDGWHYLGSSHGGYIDSENDTAFGLWAETGYYNAVRWMDNPLEAGHALSLDISSNWREGHRGLDIMTRDNGDWVTLFNFDIHSGGYGETGWDWYEGNDYFHVEVNQLLSDEFQVTVTRMNDDAQWTSDPVGGTVEGFRVYVGDTGGGSERDVHFNNIRVVPEPGAGMLTLWAALLLGGSLYRKRALR